MNHQIGQVTSTPSSTVRTNSLTSLFDDSVEDIPAPSRPYEAPVGGSLTKDPTPTRKPEGPQNGMDAGGPVE